MLITHITIQTQNFDQEVLFFENYAEMTIQRDLRPAGKPIVFLSGNGAETEIEVINNPSAEYSGNENLSIGFIAHDLDSLREQLIRDGFEPTPFISPMECVRFFFVKDPAGVKIQFM